MTQVRLGKDSIGKDRIEIGEDSKDAKPQKPKRHKHGEYKNVLLSDIDFEKLKAEFPEVLTCNGDQKEITAWNKRYGLNAIYAGKHWTARKEDSQFWHIMVSSCMNRAKIRAVGSHYLLERQLRHRQPLVDGQDDC